MIVLTPDGYIRMRGFCRFILFKLSIIDSSNETIGATNNDGDRYIVDAPDYRGEQTYFNESIYLSDLRREEILSDSKLKRNPTS